MLKTFINNYIACNKEKYPNGYVLKQESWHLDNWTSAKDLGDKVIFVNGFYYIVSINGDTFPTINESLLTLKSNLDTVDYGKLYEVDVFLGYAFIRSNYISIHDTNLSIVKASPTWVTAEINGHISFISLTKKINIYKCTQKRKYLVLSELAIMEHLYYDVLMIMVK